MHNSIVVHHFRVLVLFIQSLQNTFYFLVNGLFFFFLANTFIFQHLHVVRVWKPNYSIALHFRVDLNFNEAL